jgi:hypothetical protein
MAKHENLAERHGKDLVDRDCHRIGKLEDVYVDVESDEPMFGHGQGGRVRPPLDVCATARDHDRP